jgi:hypothetical protein
MVWRSPPRLPNLVFGFRGRFFVIGNDDEVTLTGRTFCYDSSPEVSSAMDITTVRYDAAGNQRWASRFRYAGHDYYPPGGTWYSAPVGLATDGQGMVLVGGELEYRYDQL